MPAERAEPIQCPKCLYDLTGVPGDRGSCPECGRQFRKASLIRRRESLVALGLGFVGWGTLATMVAGGVASLLAFMPRPNDGSQGDSVAAAAWLKLAPMALEASGALILGWCMGRTRKQRLIAAVIVAVFGLLLIHGAASNGRTGGGYFLYSWWLQPYAWTFPQRWLAPIASFVLGLLICARLRRLADVLDFDGVRTTATIASNTLPVVLILACASNTHREVLDWINAGPGRGWTRSDGNPPYVISWSFGELLEYVSGLAWTGVWLLIGITALVTRKAWTTEMEEAAA